VQLRPLKAAKGKAAQGAAWQLCGFVLPGTRMMRSGAPSLWREGRACAVLAIQGWNKPSSRPVEDLNRHTGQPVVRTGVR
jgi:hypothetical protein